MKRKHRRLIIGLLAGVALSTAAVLVLTAFEDAIVFFRSPTELLEGRFEPGQRLRIGGLVVAGSVMAAADGITTRFRVTDLVETVSVSFTGVLPDLFREGQGVVAEGHLKDGVFIATDVLAKHDENYLPREVAEALEKSGKWTEKAAASLATGGGVGGATIKEFGR